MFTGAKNQFSDVVIKQISIQIARGYPCCFVRMDNADDWKDLEDYCDSKGITVEYTAPYTPQWNGKAERAFPHLRNKAHACMDASDIRKDAPSVVRLSEGTAMNPKGIPVQLWAHAVDDATVMDNLLPRKGFSTGYKAFGLKPPVKPKHLAPWGVRGYITKPKKKGQRHWIPKAEKGYRVGYPDKHASGCYLVFKASTGRVVITRNANWSSKFPKKTSPPSVNDDSDDESLKVPVLVPTAVSVSMI
jgi:hypothetical protein